jgi:F0F1-type ATP synthase assembly protein I
MAPGRLRGACRVPPAEEHRAQVDPETRATWQGFSDALAHGFELAGTTVIFVLLGLWLDNSIHTRPLFTIALGLLAVIGLGARAYYRYAADMAREDERKPWRRRTSE